MSRCWKQGALLATGVLVLSLLAACTAKTDPLSATITSPGGDRSTVAGTALTFAASASGGTLPYTYAWDFDSTGVGGGPAAQSGATPDPVTYSNANVYKVKLTVTDAASDTASATVTITVTAGAGALTVDSLAGAWAGPCRPEIDSPNAVGSRSEGLRITRIGANTGSFVHREYDWPSSDHCVGAPQKFAEIQGTMTLSSVTSSTAFLDATQAYVTMTAQTLTLYDAGLVQAYNDNNGGAGTYGWTGWEQGTPRSILGIDESGASVPTTQSILLLRAGDVLFMSDTDSQTGSSFPTSVQPAFVRAANDPVTVSALHSANGSDEWVGPCQVEDNANFASTAQLERLNFTAGSTPTLTITSTHFAQSTFAADTACDTLSGGATVQVIEVQTLNVSFHSTAGLFTARGMTTAGDATLTAHTLTPYTGAAVTALNTAGGSGAYGKNSWAAGTTTDVFALGVEEDGTTPRRTAMTFGALLANRHLYAGGEDDPTQAPLDADGYPVYAPNPAYLPREQVTDAGNLAFNWVSPCREGSTVQGYSSTASSLAIGASGPVTYTQWDYPGTHCTVPSGTSVQTSSPVSYTASVVGSPNTVPVPRGKATAIQVSGPSGNLCVALLRTGGRLYSSELVTPAAGSGGDCTFLDDFGGFDAQHGLHQRFAGRERSPVLATTVPVASWKRTCRQDPSGGNDSRDYAQTFGQAGTVGSLLSSQSLVFGSIDGSCSQDASVDQEFTAVLTFGSTKTVTEGDATQLGLGDGTHILLRTLIKFLSNAFWVSTDNSPLGTDGYPTTLDPGEPFRRAY